MFANLTLPLTLGRLWVTFLWSLVIGTGVGAWDWAERTFHDQAQAMNLLLLPTREPDATRREALRQALLDDGVVREASWLSPEEMQRSLERSSPDFQAAGLVPGEAAWLPWVLEVRLRDPLTHAAAVQGLVARLRGDPDWELALWDSAALNQFLAVRGRLRIVLGTLLALVLVAGTASLLRMAWPSQAGAWLIVWSAVMGSGGPVVVWMAAQIAGVAVEPRNLMVAAVAGFLLAALIAPVLRVRGSRFVSLSITEADNERVR